jgi:pimeloyl-ACP methyl ester carboxylesterase
MTILSDIADNGYVSGKQFWLNLDPEPIYGVLHAPRLEDRTGTAVLMLPPFGWDNDCSYRARRDWATALAEAGVTVARIDFPGTEDSAGSPHGVNRLPSWLDAATATVRWLRQTSGCERLIGIGIGLGGLIAHQAVAAGAEIDELILWGVRASGRATVREMLVYAAVVAGEFGEDQDARDSSGALGVGGHPLSNETVSALKAVKLAAAPLPTGRIGRALLIGRDAHGIDETLRQHLTDSGVAVTTVESNGDYLSLMAPPELGMRPRATISASVDWVLEGAHPGASPVEPQPVSDVATTTDTVEFPYDGVSIRERFSQLQTPYGRLVGIISEPVGVEPASCCLVVVNTGSLRHTGPNRLFTEIARRAAAAGIPAARFDLPGLGDSDGVTVRTFERQEKHDAESQAALRMIYDHLQGLGVSNRFVPVGLCLGGYLAVHGALEDQRAVAAIGINVGTLRWNDLLRKTLVRGAVVYGGLDAIASGDTQAPRELEAVAAGAGGWFTRSRRAIVRGLVHRHYLIDAAARRRFAQVDMLWRLAHRAEVAALLAEIHRFGSADARVVLLLGEEEGLVRLLSLHKLAAALHRYPKIKLERLPMRDHLVRPLWAHELVFDHVSLALEEARATVERLGAEAEPAVPVSGDPASLPTAG